MRASVLVGRVGGLAVALGIGSGMAVGGVGAAWANPADSASGAGAASASDPASTRTTPRQPSVRQRGGRSAHATEKPSATASPQAGHSDLVEVAPANTLSRGGRAAAGVAPEVLTSKDENPAGSETAGPVSSAPALGLAEGPVVLPTTAAESPAPVAVPPATAPPATAPVLMVPVDEPSATTVVPPVMVPTPQQSAAAPGVVESVLTALSVTGPVAPAESAVSWVMLAAARRELGNPAAAQSSPATAVATTVPIRQASAASMVTPKDTIDIAFSGFNSSIGWIPFVGTAINGVKFAIDVVGLASSVLTLNFPQVITELGNLVVDAVGLVPVVGAPVASLLYQTVLGGNVKLGALVQESLQSFFNVDSTWSQYQFYVEAVDVSVGLGGSHPSIATVSKPTHSGVAVMVDVINTGFESGWSVPLEGRLQLLSLAYS